MEELYRGGRTDEWSPRDRTKSRFTWNLRPGQLVVWNRQPYRVVEVGERAHVDWGADYREAWIEAGQPEPSTWDNRPMAIVLQDEDHPDAEPLHLVGPAYGGWSLLPFSNHPPGIRVTRLGLLWARSVTSIRWSPASHSSP